MRRLVAVALAAVLASCASCAGNSGGTDPSSTLEILGGSELKDMLPVLEQAQAETGIAVKLSYADSLDGAERIAADEAGDAAWFASDKYIALADASAKVLDHEPIMLSPVVVGVRRSVAKALHWDPPNKVGWKDIAAAASSGRFHYAMASPTASNSGFSALVGVATALAGGQALTADTIDAKGLKGFFSGQTLTSGSSGFLADAFADSRRKINGIVNYENVLLELDASSDLDEKLDLIYPEEGIVTADYPLMLLDADKRPAYLKLVNYLRSRNAQRQIQRVTSRRPALPGVALDERFGHQLLVEVPFPANVAIVQQLLEDFQAELRKPAHTFYVLDTSGSMAGPRIKRLKTALTGLAGLDTSFSGHFTRFAPRERVTMITFSDRVHDSRTFDVDSSDPSAPGLRDLRAFVDRLDTGGSTAIYTALDAAYSFAANARVDETDMYTSIVLMSDGENNAGMTGGQFRFNLQNKPAEFRGIRVFTVLFGEASRDELAGIARETGGKVFDARRASLASVFKEIRGYQ